MRFSIPFLQAVIAPVAAPVVPAALLGAEIFRVLSEANVVYLLALFSAIAGAIAIETSGGLAFFMSVRGWQRKQWGVMTVAGLAALLYLIIVIGSILLIPGVVTRAVAIMSGIAVVAYIGMALYFADRESGEEQDKTFVQDIEYLRQQRLTTNSETRLIKAQGGGVRPGVRGEQGRTEDWQATIWTYLDQHPDAGPRELNRELGCSLSTASKHRNSWLRKKRH
jgi:UPF0716 family protein affecting phage T7 exclusion